MDKSHVQQTTVTIIQALYTPSRLFLFRLAESSILSGTQLRITRTQEHQLLTEELIPKVVLHLLNFLLWIWLQN